MICSISPKWSKRNLDFTNHSAKLTETHISVTHTHKLCIYYMVQENSVIKMSMKLMIHLRIELCHHLV